MGESPKLAKEHGPLRVRLRAIEGDRDALRRGNQTPRPAEPDAQSGRPGPGPRGRKPWPRSVEAEFGEQSEFPKPNGHGL